MASRFVLTAQLQLQAPSNTQQVINDLRRQLAGVKIPVEIKNAAEATKQVDRLTRSTREAGTAAENMGRSFGLAFKRFAAFTIASRTISLFTNSLANSIDEAIDFQREMVKLAQVTQDSDESLAKLENRIFSLSSAWGVASKDLVNVTLILAQAGLKAKDLDIALEALTKTALTPTFDDITETTEGVVAILAQFKEGVGALERQLGAINRVSADFAVESGDLIEAVRRFGGVFKASGGSLEELIALFTSVRATTRESAESISTGLRTIFTRIQRPKTIEFLKQFGVELESLDGKFVGPYEAVRQLSKALGGLEEGDIQFIRIAEELGGFRQIGKVIPLLREFETAERARQSAIAGGDSLTQDAIKAQQALAVQFTKVREEFQKLIQGITNTTTFQTFVKTSLALASSFIKIAESVKPLIPLLGALAAFKFAQGVGNFASGFGSSVRGLQSFDPKRKNAGGRIHRFASGGFVPGSGNRDTVPAMLTPGEFVIRKSSVNKIGAGQLAAMNENRYAAGGIVNLIKDKETKEVGAAVLERDNPQFLKSSFIIYPEDIDKSLNLGSGRLNTRAINKLSGTYAAPRQGLGDQTYKIFDEALDNGLVTVANAAAAKISKRLSLPFNPVNKSTKVSFLQSINSGSRGNLFEQILSILNGGPFATDPNRPFDFPDGIKPPSLKQQFPGLPNAWIDAKASFDAAKPGELKSKTLSQIRYEILNDSELQKEFLNKDKILKGNEVKEDEIKRKKYGWQLPEIQALPQYRGLSAKEILETGEWEKEQPGKYQPIQKQPIQKFATGGVVPGTGNRDTVPAMLTPGEFVIRKSSVNKIGAENLAKMNKGGLAEISQTQPVKQLPGGYDIRITDTNGAVYAQYTKNQNIARPSSKNLFGSIAANGYGSYYSIDAAGATRGGGFGTELYLALMEYLTQKGKRLTSDRYTVTSDAFSFWAKAYSGKFGITKRQLDPEDFFQGKSGPPGKEISYPSIFGYTDDDRYDYPNWEQYVDLPLSDPLWALQYSYNKAPNLINDKQRVSIVNDAKEKTDKLKKLQARRAYVKAMKLSGRELPQSPKDESLVDFDIVSELAAIRSRIPIQQFAKGSRGKGVESRNTSKKRKAYVFDFDDTLAETEARVGSQPNDPDKFAQFRGDLAGKLIDSAKATKIATMAKRRAERDHDIYVLTARPSEPQTVDAINRFMQRIGAPAKGIFGVANMFAGEREPGKRPGTTRLLSTGSKKAKVLSQISSDYDQILFLDDAVENLISAKGVPGVKPIIADTKSKNIVRSKFATGGVIQRFARGSLVKPTEGMGPGLFSELEQTMAQAMTVKDPSVDARGERTIANILSQKNKKVKNPRSKKAKFEKQDGKRVIKSVTSARLAALEQYSKDVATGREISYTTDPEGQRKLNNAEIAFNKILTKMGYDEDMLDPENYYRLGGLIQKFAKGTSGKGVPLVDDILQNAPGGAILPTPSKAIQSIIDAGGATLDVDRTLIRTVGDTAYAKAKTPEAKQEVLARYFRDPVARMRDITTSPITQFGQELIKAVANDIINPKTLGIISKSSAVPGIKRYLRGKFGIPESNMQFTSGGDKVPYLEAFNKQGPKIGRMKKFAAGGAAPSDTVPALLTPGEFVINKQSAQRIGYGNLNRMNKHGVTGFARGGSVGIQRFDNGGGVPKPSNFTSLDELVDFAKATKESTKTIDDLSKSNKDTLQAQEVEFTKLIAVNTAAATVSTVLKGFADSGDKAQTGIQKLADVSANLITQVVAITSILPTLATGFKNFATNLKTTSLEAGIALRDRGTARIKGAESRLLPGGSIAGKLEKSLGNSIIRAGSFISNFADKASGAAVAVTAVTGVTYALGSAMDDLRGVHERAKKAIEEGNVAAAGKAAIDSKLASDSTILSAGFAGLGAAAVAIGVTLFGMTLPISATIVAITALIVTIGKFSGAFDYLSGVFRDTVGQAFGMDSTETIKLRAEADATAAYATKELAKNSELASQKLKDISEGRTTARSGFEAGGTFSRDIQLNVEKMNTAESARKSAKKSALEGQTMSLALSNMSITPFGPMIDLEKNRENIKQAINDELKKENDAIIAYNTELLKLFTSQEEAFQALTREYTLAGKNIDNFYEVVTKDSNLSSVVTETAKKIQQRREELKKQLLDSNLTPKGTKTPLFTENNGVIGYNKNLSQSEITETTQLFKKAGNDIEQKFNELQSIELFDIRMKNTSQSLKDNIDYIESLNFGLRNVTSAANAASLKLETIKNQDFGFNSFENSLKVLEAAVTSTGANISDAQLGVALKDLETSLQTFGASTESVNKTIGSIKNIRDIQAKATPILEQAQKRLTESATTGNAPASQRILDTFRKEITGQIQDVKLKELFDNALEKLATDETLASDIKSGNVNALLKAFDDIVKVINEDALSSLKQYSEINNELINITKKRKQIEEDYIEAQQKAIDLQIEAAKYIEEFGGEKLTPQTKLAAKTDQINLLLKAARISPLQNTESTSLKNAFKDISRAFELQQNQINQNKLNAAGTGALNGGISNAQGIDQDTRERLNKVNQELINFTKDRIELIKEELDLVNKKNQAEKESLDKLLSGDIEGFLQEQQAVGAAAALRSGDQGIISAFGAGSLAPGFKILEDQGGITDAQLQRAASLVLKNLGITDPRAAQVLSKTTTEQKSLKEQAKEFARILSQDASQSLVDLQNLQMQAVNVQLKATNLIIDNVQQPQSTNNTNQPAITQSKGGLIYANNGTFVPKGTDTVPAMLTPGEFVVNAKATRENIGLLKSINNGGKTGYSKGGTVYAQGGGYVHNGNFILDRDSGFFDLPDGSRQIDTSLIYYEMGKVGIPSEYISKYIDNLIDKKTNYKLQQAIEYWQKKNQNTKKPATLPTSQQTSQQPTRPITGPPQIPQQPIRPTTRPQTQPSNTNQPQLPERYNGRFDLGYIDYGINPRTGNRVTASIVPGGTMPQYDEPSGPPGTAMGGTRGSVNYIRSRGEGSVVRNVPNRQTRQTTNRQLGQTTNRQTRQTTNIPNTQNTQNKPSTNFNQALPPQPNRQFGIKELPLPPITNVPSYPLRESVLYNQERFKFDEAYIEKEIKTKDPLATEKDIKFRMGLIKKLVNNKKVRYGHTTGSHITDYFVVEDGAIMADECLSDSLEALYDPNSTISNIGCTRAARLAVLAAQAEVMSESELEDFNAAYKGLSVGNQELKPKSMKQVDPKNGKIVEDYFAASAPFEYSELIPGDQLWFVNPWYYKLFDLAKTDMRAARIAYQQKAGQFKLKLPDGKVIYKPDPTMEQLTKYGEISDDVGGEEGSNCFYGGNGYIVDTYGRKKSFQDQWDYMSSWASVKGMKSLGYTINPPKDFTIRERYTPVTPEKGLYSNANKKAENFANGGVVKSSGPCPECDKHLSAGGLVYASRGTFVPKGTDTVPAMLTPGEFVVKAQAAKNNLGLLQSINNENFNGSAVYAQAGGSIANSNSLMRQSDINRRQAKEIIGSLPQDLRRSIISENPRNNNISNNIFDPSKNKDISDFEDSVTKFSDDINTFKKSTDSFKESVDKLMNFQLSVKLDPTNVNVNFAGASFLGSLKEDIKKELMTEIGNRIKNGSYDETGRLNINK